MAGQRPTGSGAALAVVLTVKSATARRSRSLGTPGQARHGPGRVPAPGPPLDGGLERARAIGEHRQGLGSGVVDGPVLVVDADLGTDAEAGTDLVGADRAPAAIGGVPFEHQVRCAKLTANKLQLADLGLGWAV
ncbi:hypothetical protein OG508_00925 [Streptomyces sp. NBC_01108]|uniref:hypothetical protein n=1 Tax=Streptomyces sp. NBC_01108 TaxID=2903751 RepID=UPI0038732F29|nr:hypothetical protein OG508_00925 [Streptomyces sp. NBC_01108]